MHQDVAMVPVIQNVGLQETHLNFYFTNWKIPSIERQRKCSNKSSATVTNPFNQFFCFHHAKCVISLHLLYILTIICRSPCVLSKPSSSSLNLNNKIIKVRCMFLIWHPVPCFWLYIKQLHGRVLVPGKTSCTYNLLLFWWNYVKIFRKVIK